MRGCCCWRCGPGVHESACLKQGMSGHAGGVTLWCMSDGMIDGEGQHGAGEGMHAPSQHD